ncbi:hypothetical protein [Paenibacillus sp. SYP-B4298]|uniref:hypothetical protein n=1 Tax=Paenibacillus sp. SYP-B4298 TaxID=2996034 RepID=UPI0022DDDDA8|nr:hypothetical protein [Paenibacillus sp. SYP-B4298]
MILTINRVDEQHLTEVMNYAAKVGSVTINVWYDGETVYALEGAHRVEAAKRLRLPLILNKREWDAVIATDCDDADHEDGMITVEKLFEYAYDNLTRHTGGVYSFDDFASVELND